MVGSPALLLLLALGLCCPGQGQKPSIKFRDRGTRHPQVGRRLELECQTSKDDNGMSWIRQDKGGTLHFIVYISSLSRTTFKEKERTSTRFQAMKDNGFYRLIVKSFTLQDEGNYFCLVNSNQMLYFSPGQPVFFPVTTTVAPTTPGPTTQHGINTTGSCLKTPNSGKATDVKKSISMSHALAHCEEVEGGKEKEMKFFCDIFIWVPLAGAFLLLLLALAATIMLCQQTRRRRCRCKRSANGKPNVKDSMPGRHI
ncbi:PREDICTED: T-cell surface glycoprotein CD8 alpha chain [Leptosomus discolor]|uniref:T-cell surface glycoprotein CD8 alpha chain n=1 Tax=Leptosomus discolor TaxID=188344 RepID=UPI0005224A2B|nr:PREDICTED: T-cell surface glycoprotein CD8 alpha chain [Leptosomus discolor]